MAAPAPLQISPRSQSYHQPSSPEVTEAPARTSSLASFAFSGGASSASVFAHSAAAQPAAGKRPEPLPRRRTKLSAAEAEARAALLREAAIAADEANKGGAVLDENFKGMFISEWLTQQPLNMQHPNHIWLHADVPPADTTGGSAPSMPEEARQRIEYLNQAGLVHLQDGRLDDALACFKEMEKDIKEQAQPGSRVRLALLAVAYNNASGFYYRKGIGAPALQYAQRAAGLEQRAHGAPDFATLLRMGAACCKCKQNKEALAHFLAAIEGLKEAAMEAAAAHSETQKPAQPLSLLARAEAATGGGSKLPAAYDGACSAYLAVAYHNLAVQYCNLGQLQEANAMINVADQLASKALPAKHRWAKHICATLQRLRDLHVARSFVTHSLRPRLADHQARKNANPRTLLGGSRQISTKGSFSSHRGTKAAFGSGGVGGAVRQDEQAAMARSSSLPQLAKR